ncbi:MAG: peptide chain release factor N(5)-glutamine methyltransferase [Clostridia bacterium]|nr:peptide chain release factor N(5)-glutamine methyltransferase [Clostridia bacterium]
MARKNCTNIGGQAVLEGVMMRGKTAEAVAVRDPYGTIQVESTRLPEQKSFVYKVPILRGVLNFINSMISGSKTIMRSGEVYGEDVEEEPSKFDKWLQKNLKIDTMKVATFIGLLLGLALAVALFVIVPTLIKNFVFKYIDLSAIGAWGNFIENLLLGIVKIAIFIGYLLAVSSMKEIKRLFAYHGAEHKTIACYEACEELTVENVKKHSRLHDRCGTNFMFIVMFVSILFYAVFFSLIEALTGWTPSKPIYEILIRIACLPLIAGFSYEVLKFLAKFDNVITRLLKAPGRGLQLITTREPDDTMIEVAITAFNTVLALEADKEMPTTTFRTSVPLKKVFADMTAISADKEWEREEIVMTLAGIKNRSGLKPEKVIYKDVADRAIIAWKERVESGKPLQYILGIAPFYGLDFEVDGRVLIPRFDTEILAERVINRVNGKNQKVLELCTGSGAVAVTIAKNTDAQVTATDISVDALEVAKRNANKHGVSIEFIESDLFDNIEGKYDVIVVNPPYIPSEDVLNLDSEVKDYEPHLALDGGVDGLDIYRKIKANYMNYLNEGGALIMEIGVNQAGAIEELFGKVEFIKDYNNPPIERVAVILNGVE